MFDSSSGRIRTTITITTTTSTTTTTTITSTTTTTTTTSSSMCLIPRHTISALTASYTCTLTYIITLVQPILSHALRVFSSSLLQTLHPCFRIYLHSPPHFPSHTYSHLHSLIHPAHPSTFTLCTHTFTITLAHASPIASHLPSLSHQHSRPHPTRPFTFATVFAHLHYRARHTHANSNTNPNPNTNRNPNPNPNSSPLNGPSLRA